MNKTIGITCFIVTIICNCFVAMGCDCIENNHAIQELDEYALFNAQLAVWVETEDVIMQGEDIVLKATVVSQIKNTPIKSIYLKGRDEKEYGFELSKMANQKLLFIEVELVGDTVWVNHCKRLWVWVDDPNKIKSSPDYFKIMNRQYVVASFMAKSYLQGHNTIQYTSGRNTALGKFRKELPHGRWAHFTYYGGLYAKGSYTDGVKDGPWIESYFKQKMKGNKVRLFKIGYAKGNYVNGERDGKWVIFNKQRGTEVIFYRHGQVFEKM